MNNLVKSFNEISEKYDSQRKKLIPCFDDFYGIVKELAEVNGDNNRILDIGAGTGLLTEFVYSKFPDADYTLIDISEDMLNIARKRFGGKTNIKYISADYTNFVFTEKYDLVISSLSIHHLENNDKQKLFSKIYDSLKPGGIFINADQFLAENDEMENRYREVWYRFIEQSGLPPEDIQSAHKRMELDKLSTAEDSLNWLKNAGFNIVEMVYKYMMFGVIYCRKAGNQVYR